MAFFADPTSVSVTRLNTRRQAESLTFVNYSFTEVRW